MRTPTPAEAASIRATAFALLTEVRRASIVAGLHDAEEPSLDFIVDLRSDLVRTIEAQREARRPFEAVLDSLTPPFKARLESWFTSHCSAVGVAASDARRYLDVRAEALRKLPSRSKAVRSDVEGRLVAARGLFRAWDLSFLDAGLNHECAALARLSKAEPQAAATGTNCAPIRKGGSVHPGGSRAAASDGTDPVNEANDERFLREGISAAEIVTKFSVRRSTVHDWQNRRPAGDPKRDQRTGPALVVCANRGGVKYFTIESAKACVEHHATWKNNHRRRR